MRGGAAAAEMEVWTGSPAVFPQSATRGQQSPGPSHAVVAARRPHRPDALGCPRQMASLPHPACAYPAPAPGVLQLLFAWKSYLLASSELAAPPQSPSPIARHLAPQ